MMKNRISRRLVPALCILALLCALSFASRVLKPKRFDYGSTWGQFLKEKKDSVDVLFFGTSKTYCNIIPATIWKETGLRSYVMAGPAQTLPVTYYYLRESLKTQSPKVIFVEITGLIYAHETEYQMINVGYMPFGVNKIQAILGETTGQNRLGALSSLYAYHTRWSSVGREDLRIALHGYSKDDLAGYTFLSDATPMDGTVAWGSRYEDSDYERNYAYLKKIAALCEEENIEVVFYLSPSCAVFKYDFQPFFEPMVEAIEHSRYVDFNQYAAEMNIDDQTDYFDFMHFNVYGAEKFSAWLAAWMQREYDLPASGSDTELWQHRYDVLRNKLGTH